MTLKEIIAKSKLSPVQLGKSIKSLKSITESEAEFEVIKKEFIPEAQLERVTQIVAGLEQEDEFAILCRLMGTCQSMVGIDQTPVIPNQDETPPDFLATFAPGCSVVAKTSSDLGYQFKCFLEIKSCKDTSYKISRNALQRRINFAARYGLPLIFAIRLWSESGAALWTMVSSDYLLSSNRRVDVSDMTAGVRHILLDDYFLMPIPNLHVAHYYDSQSKALGIRHSEFGVQIKTILLFRDFQYEILKKDLVFFSALFDSYQPQEVQVKRDGNIAVQVLNVGIQGRSLADLLYTMNRLATDDQGHRIYDPSRFSSRFDSKEGKPTMITREMVEYYTSLHVQSQPVFMRLAFEEPEAQLKRLQELCARQLPQADG